jgi:hypothetical protein
MMKFQALVLLTSLTLAIGHVVQPVLFTDCPLAVGDTVFEDDILPQMVQEAENIFATTYPESVSSIPGDETVDSRRLEEAEPKMRHVERRLGVCPKNCSKPSNIDKCARLNCYSSTGRRLTSGNNRRLTEFVLSDLSQKLNQKADEIGQNYNCQIIIFVEESPEEVDEEAV